MGSLRSSTLRASTLSTFPLLNRQRFMRTRWMAVLALALGVACSSRSPVGIGHVCDDGTPCAAGLYCYSSEAGGLTGLCTMSCAGPGSDPCTASDPDARCVDTGSDTVCALACEPPVVGGPTGATCPAGTRCGGAGTSVYCVHL